MLKKLCSLTDMISGINDPILAAIAERFNIPEDELVWESLQLLHDGKRIQIYHWVDKKQKIAEDIENEWKESEIIKAAS